MCDQCAINARSMWLLQSFEKRPCGICSSASGKCFPSSLTASTPEYRIMSFDCRPASIHCLDWQCVLVSYMGFPTIAPPTSCSHCPFEGIALARESFSITLIKQAGLIWGRSYRPTGRSLPYTRTRLLDGRGDTKTRGVTLWHRSCRWWHAGGPSITFPTKGFSITKGLALCGSSIFELCVLWGHFQT
jgi:hypothetical protein